MSEEVSRSSSELDFEILERNMYIARSEYVKAETESRKSALESKAYQKEERIAKRKLILSLREMSKLSNKPDNKNIMSENKYYVCESGKRNNTNKLEFKADSHEDAARQYVANQKSSTDFNNMVIWVDCVQQLFTFSANAETGECTLGERTL